MKEAVRSLREQGYKTFCAWVAQAGSEPKKGEVFMQQRNTSEEESVVTNSFHYMHLFVYLAGGCAAFAGNQELNLCFFLQKLNPPHTERGHCYIFESKITFND